MFSLTVWWHAVALCVSVRCVWSCGLQGGAVLGLSIGSHDTCPLRVSPEEWRNNEEAIGDKFLFFVMSWVQIHFFYSLNENLIPQMEQRKTLVFLWNNDENVVKGQINYLQFSIEQTWLFHYFILHCHSEEHYDSNVILINSDFLISVNVMGVTCSR